MQLFTDTTEITRVGLADALRRYILVDTTAYTIDLERHCTPHVIIVSLRQHLQIQLHATVPARTQKNFPSQLV